MRNLQFYIDGQWVSPDVDKRVSLRNPATEEVFAEIAVGGASDVDKAVKAARRAFATFSNTTLQERRELLERVLKGFEARQEELARTIMQEIGAPYSMSLNAQAASGPNHIKQLISNLETFEFEELKGSTLLVKEPIGVCGLITPWNWPVNQIIVKVAPALAAGCTMVLKPSEISPLSAIIVAEILHDAGVPAGVFNLVNGTGEEVGAAIASHPDIDMVSFTGSTRAGVAVAKAAAETVKRVTQELGGKAPNIILPGADLERVITPGVARCYGNTGQSCSAATRLLVHESDYEQAVELARQAAETYRPGSPEDAAFNMGPVVNESQFNRVQEYIQIGIDEGAKLVTGGLGRPEGIEKGYFVKPTIFANVNNSMRIAREEIFGPVLVIIPYSTVDEAVEIANDTPYGLSAYVQGDPDTARQVSRRLRAGNVHINYPAMDRGAPFGGYKRSGNGREWGEFGLLEYLEQKAVIGYEV